MEVNEHCHCKQTCISSCKASCSLLWLFNYPANHLRGSDLFTKAIAVLKDHNMKAKWADFALGKKLTMCAGDKQMPANSNKMHSKSQWYDFFDIFFFFISLLRGFKQKLMN